MNPAIVQLYVPLAKNPFHGFFPELVFCYGKTANVAKIFYKQRGFFTSLTYGTTNGHLDRFPYIRETEGLLRIVGSRLAGTLPTVSTKSLG